ncbi:hypothetical protein RND81_08G135100 [Saponaria officinalis]|uniref:Pentatricopeptide repeat-containing protein n=1 Tax=Saponaria officinalis TaxID=3572 RepID=A0AAW1J6Y8_SAPOF
MAISSLNRLMLSINRPKSTAFSLTTVINLSSISENFCDHLLNHTQNPEKTLIKIGAKLNASCVSEVLRRFSTSKPQLGLRFFIWAGVQSNYRHSQFMYSFACNVLQIGRNPSRIRDVVEDYNIEGCVINEARVCEESLPDSTIYNVVIGLFCEKGDYEMAIGLMREMEKSNLYPDMITYMSMLKCFCNAGQLEDACLLFKAMKSRGCAANLVAYSALLDGLCRFRHTDKARGLNVISYTSVIQNLCEKGKSMEALSILERMGRFNCSPNRITVSVLVKGLCADGHIDEAFKLVVRVGDEGHVPIGECYSSLVIWLLNIKRLEEAEKHFRWMLDNSLRPNGLACSIMLKELCAKGRFLDAFHLLEDVEKKGSVVTIDSDIYSILFVGLRRQMNVVEVDKLSSLMAEKGIPVGRILA